MYVVILSCSLRQCLLCVCCKSWLQVWELSQQHAQRVAELEAELKQKSMQTSQLKMDAAKQATAVQAQVQQVRLRRHEWAILTVCLGIINREAALTVCLGIKSLEAVSMSLAQT